MRVMFFPFSLLLCLALLSGCSSNPAQQTELSERQFYETARKNLKSRAYLTAIEELEELETRFPFGVYSQQAQLDLIYAYYRSLDYGSAIATAERFIRQNPGHPGVPYALYMKGMANYKADEGLMDRFSPTDRSARDLGGARDAFDDFAQLIRRFPDSEYAPDARARMLHIRNLLARQEVHIGRYYLRREAYVAAARRGQYVIEHFPNTPANRDALKLLVEAWYAMGKLETAEEIEAILLANFPEEKSILAQKKELEARMAAKRREQDEPSWLFKLTLGLLG